MRLGLIGAMVPTIWELYIKRLGSRNKYMDQSYRARAWAPSMIIGASRIASPYVSYSH